MFYYVTRARVCALVACVCARAVCALLVALGVCFLLFLHFSCAASFRFRCMSVFVLLHFLRFVSLWFLCRFGSGGHRTFVFVLLNFFEFFFMVSLHLSSFCGLDWSRRDCCG